ncbi:YhbY family RNA-binding protein [Candidatus Pacearchaeota archaeon]|nr:YhbY family RNA-binding protein [Candidatus Pacearchaeota archaeon]
MTKVGHIQLGKQGVTDNFIQTLKDHFKKQSNVRISVLRSCCRDKEELKKITLEILEKLGNHYTTKTIGYVIAVKKWRKAVRE